MSESPILRGFRARRPANSEADRVPPGQHVTADFPVLSAGPTPKSNPESWHFTLRRNGAIIAKWSWAEFEALPQTNVNVDIHCVTTWSKLDTNWRGVTIDALLVAAGLVEPPTPYALIHCDGGYTTNLPMEDLLHGKAMVATRYENVALVPVHGGPARLLVPHPYFWKSAKWARELEFTDTDEPGFWESLGYNKYGDPWREQRYAGD